MDKKRTCRGAIHYRSRGRRNVGRPQEDVQFILWYSEEGVRTGQRRKRRKKTKKKNKKNCIKEEKWCTRYLREKRL
jgi:hypothetical protein